MNVTKAITKRQLFRLLDGKQIMVRVDFDGSKVIKNAGQEQLIETKSADNEKDTTGTAYATPTTSLRLSSSDEHTASAWKIF
jgi:hypothetical protein